MYWVSRILDIKCPRTSMTFERYALKWLCVSRCVESSFTCLFSMIFILEVLKSYTIVFVFGNVLEIIPKDHLRVFEDRPQTCWQGCPRQSPNGGEVDGSWAYRSTVNGIRWRGLWIGWDWILKRSLNPLTVVKHGP